MSSKDEFPNNWERVFNMPESKLQTPPYVMVDQWSNDWKLPSSVNYIIRATCPVTKRVREYTYKQDAAAERKVQQLMEEFDEILVMSHAEINHLVPHLVEVDDDDEPDDNVTFAAR